MSASIDQFSRFRLGVFNPFRAVEIDPLLQYVPTSETSACVVVSLCRNPVEIWILGLLLASYSYVVSVVSLCAIVPRGDDVLPLCTVFRTVQPIIKPDCDNGAFFSGISFRSRSCCGAWIALKLG